MVDKADPVGAANDSTVTEIATYVAPETNTADTEHATSRGISDVDPNDLTEPPGTVLGRQDEEL